MTSIAAALVSAQAAWSATHGSVVQLHDPADLGGSERSAVFRVAVDGAADLPATAVVKAYPLTELGPPPEFADEVAAAAFCPFGPRLLAHDRGAAVAVFTDLGGHGSLADLLLGVDEAAARAGLLAWARALGSMAAWSVGRRAEYDAVRAALGLAPTGDRLAEHLAESSRVGLDALLAYAGAQSVEASCAPELRDAQAVLRGGPLTVFSPADACPDNNLLTPGGLRLLDYESAGFHSAFLDAVYCRMPFASCWCVFEIPAGLAAEVERTYRDLVVAAAPEAADDTLWEEGLLRAEVLWVLSQARWLLPRALGDDGFMGGSLGGPPRRTLLVHRWRRLTRSAPARSRFPHLVEVLERAASQADATWGAAPALGLYPAFSG